MSRIDLLDISTMSGDAQEKYARLPVNLTRALLRTGDCTSGYLTLAFSFRSAKLAPRFRELVILRVAALSQSAYERMHHLDPARMAGWSDDQIGLIELGADKGLDPASHALLPFVEECVLDVSVSDRTFQAAREHFSEREIAEATLLIGYYMMTARFLETLKIDLDDTPCAVLTEPIAFAPAA
jgi:alkylhydroperoxidase family enzyme